ncbi:MAG TPA: ABC transporter permease [Fimbriimonadaceae bacterium]|nr:ABC transporter permease [Fimbriimonadaceae bacterium]
MSKPLYVIKPPSGLALVNIFELWQFRDLFLAFASRDLRLRYRQTVLGVAWVLFQPLIAAAAFAFVFGRIAKLNSEGVPYFLFAYAGMTCWTLFHAIVGKSATALTHNTALVSKVYFPRLIMPYSLSLTALIDTAVSLGLLLVLMPFFGIMPGPQVLLLLVALPCVLLLASGVASFVSALAVPYRDVQHVAPVLLNLLLYISPVAYSTSEVPDGLTRQLFLLNPIAPLVELFRYSVLGVGRLDWGAVGYAASVSVVVFLLGALVFRNMERRFADVI